MSTAVVTVATVDSIKPHPNADRLDVAEILGWQVVVGKGNYQEGDVVIYCPPDHVVPQRLSDALDVTRYLSNGRVRQVKLRGEPSFGFAFSPSAVKPLYQTDWHVDVGQNVSDFLGITKYEPPIKFMGGDTERDHALFPKYTEIENLRNYPYIFQPGELVIATEKVAGSNCRVGIVEGERMAGSHRLRRKQPEVLASNPYWYPFALDSVEALLTTLSLEHRQVILYGEVFGRIQKLHYGNPNGLSFAAFDLMVDGRYLNAVEFFDMCARFGVPNVPILSYGTYSLAHIKRISEGPTLAGGDHFREGVVVRPMEERTDPKVGRVVLKFVSDSFLFGNVDEGEVPV